MAPAVGSKRPPAPPAFDFSSVTPQDVAAPVREVSVSAAENPALPWVKASWDAKKHTATVAGEQLYLGAGKAIIVPQANASQTETLLRRAAAQLSKDTGERIGMAIKTDENPRVDADGNLTDEVKGSKVQRGFVAIRFAAKTGKKPYTRKTTVTPVIPTPDKTNNDGVQANN